MDITLIIPSKDRESILFTSLEKAYSATLGLEAEIIIINDSKTSEITIPPKWIDKVKVVSNPKSGVASARNLGAQEASSDLLLFMDDDMWIAADNIRTTLLLHKDRPDGCCINLNWVYPPELQEANRKSQFGRYLHYFGFDTFKGWSKGLNWDDQQLFPSNGITSQYLSIKKVDFERTGGYNEQFPHAGFEDHDFSERLVRAGIQSYVFPLSMIYHNEADRMDLKAWLARKKRGGETRRVAVDMGYQELDYVYGPIKSVIYRAISQVKPLMYGLIGLIPNVKIFDPIYFRVFNLMLGSALYEGFHTRK